MHQASQKHINGDRVIQVDDQLQGQRDEDSPAEVCCVLADDVVPSNLYPMEVQE